MLLSSIDKTRRQSTKEEREKIKIENDQQVIQPRGQLKYNQTNILIS